MSILAQKPCKRCGETLRNKEGKCVRCKSETDKRYREKHAEQVKAKKRQYREDNPEKIRAGYLRWLEDNRDKKAAIDQRWAQANPEKVKENHKRWRSQTHNKAKVQAVSIRWRENNQDKQKQQRRDWVARNHDLLVAKNHRRRANLRNAPGKYTPQEWRDLLAKFGNRCLCCGRNDLTLSVDHVIPLSKGGTNDISNIQPLCMNCNDRKGTKTIDYRSTVMDQ